MPKNIVAMIVIAALGAIAAVYGGVSGSGAFLAAGLAVAFLLLVFIPVFYIRAKKRRRLFSRQDALLVWNYAPHEAERIAKREAGKTRRQSVRLSILASVCLAIIFAPFIVITESAGTRLLLLCIGIAAMLLPFISVAAAPSYTAAQIKKIPSVTIIGRDYILLNNRYIGINDRGGLMLVSAEVRAGDSGIAALLLTYTFLMRYGNVIHYTVEAPVPWGRNDEAMQFAESLRGKETI